MRTSLLLLALTAAIAAIAGCGDSVRRGDSYPGEPVIRFEAVLTAPPTGYRSGDHLQPKLQDVNQRGDLGGGSQRFAASSFPHRFNIEFLFPPQGRSSQDAGVDPAQVFYVEVTAEPQPDSLGRPAHRAASINYWIAYSENPARVFPFGPEGAPLDLPAGFSLVHRSCSPQQLNQLTIVPSSTLIEVVPLTQPSAEAEYLTRCGAPLPP